MQDLSRETVTFRNTEAMKALPMRRLGSFLLGDGLGGAGTHWNGMTFRFSPYDFQLKTMTEQRYGRNKLGPDYQLQDYPLTYDEMEPYYTAFEEAVGVAAGTHAERIDCLLGRGLFEKSPLPLIPQTLYICG